MLKPDTGQNPDVFFSDFPTAGQILLTFFFPMFPIGPSDQMAKVIKRVKKNIGKKRVKCSFDILT